MLARAVKMSVFVNRSRVGALAQDTWFRVDLDPGQYEIGCTSAENSEARIVQLAADEIRFIEIEPRFGIRTPRCAVVETTPENGRAGVLAGRRAQELADPANARVTPAGPISIIYRDDATNERTLNGVVSYGAVLGRDRSVDFTVKNLNAEPACKGTFTKEGPNNGKFSLSCFGGYFNGSGNYERKTGDPNGRFIAHGQTSRGFPIVLMIGRSAGKEGG
jgi:hypothetical protein